MRPRRYARSVRNSMIVGEWEPHTCAEVEFTLPSADDRLHFDVSVSVEARWGGVGPLPPSLLDIAREGMARRAEQVSAQRALTASERLRGELNTALFRWERVAATDVHARGRCVSVDVDEELVAAVEMREQAQRRHVAMSWRDQQRRHDREHMCAVLLDPLRATASWFLDNQDKPEQVATIAQSFQEARNVLAPEQQQDSAGKLVDELLGTADEAMRDHLVRTLRKAFAEYGRQDLMTRLETPREDEARE